MIYSIYSNYYLYSGAIDNFLFFVWERVQFKTEEIFAFFFENDLVFFVVFHFEYNGFLSLLEDWVKIWCNGDLERDFGLWSMASEDWCNGDLEHDFGLWSMASEDWCNGDLERDFGLWSMVSEDWYNGDLEWLLSSFELSWSYYS